MSTTIRWTLWRCLCVALFALALSCSGGEASNNGTTTEPECATGSEGCACDQGGVCGLSGAGQQLACVFGVCEVPACEAGSAGCACDSGACDAGLECSDASGVERCEVPGCELGAEGCGCNLDRTCDAGLGCFQGTCQQLSCRVGSDGCACSQRYACSENHECDLVNDTCVEAGSCTPGTSACACRADGGCDDGLACISDLCVDPNCVPGLEGCPCPAEGECGVDSDGEQLVCEADICTQMACPSGQTGCACRLGSGCDDDAANCIGGFCIVNDCVPGSEDCSCIAGGCNPGLTCKANTICVDPTGELGGPCNDDKTCNTGRRCDTSLATPECVPCTLGTLGCQCDDAGGCNPGLGCMDNGHCAGDEVSQLRTPPAEFVCATPCTENVITEDEERLCIGGLIDGCLDGQECVRGSCVAAGGEPDVCFDDSDCPEFQLCMQGYCYIECTQNSECDGDSVCHKRVCREPCSLNDEASCESGYLCGDSTDGQTGYCMVAASATGRANGAPSGNVSVSRSALTFSNTLIDQTFTLTNDSDRYVTFTLRKVEHDVLYSNGTPETVTDYDEASTCSGSECPLWWMEMGEFGRITQAREVTVRAAPECGVDGNDPCPVITVRIANNGSAVDATRWRGAIEVHSDVGSETIDLSYVATAEGRWGGTMFYFANFNADGIDDRQGYTGWISRANRDDVSGVANGLIQRWGAFRTGQLTGGWPEFKAVLNSTQTEQWNTPGVQQDCAQIGGACYLYDAGLGTLPKAYVSSLAAEPIPQGVTTFPMALNIYLPNSAPTPAHFEGKIVSEIALHYAGDPKIALTFEGDPSQTSTCDTSVTGSCVHFLSDVSARISVGGRYTLDPNAIGCSSDFALMTTPWLVPGFLEDAELDSGTGRYQRGGCVDERLPWANMPSTEQLAANRNLARSNPIPNGQVLERTIELLDGAMVDQNEMFILFRERTPSFLEDGQDMIAYGYITLTRKPTQIELEDANGDGVADAFVGSEPPTNLPAGQADVGVSCSAEILSDALGNAPLTAASAPQAIRALVDGGQPSAADRIPFPTAALSGEEVHYVCEETGLINGGPDHKARWGQGSLGPNDDSCTFAANGTCEDGGLNANASTCSIGTDVTDCGFRYTEPRVACPAKSRVTFFTVDRAQLADPAQLGCQQDGTCFDLLNRWIANNSPVLEQIEPKWSCEGDVVFCDGNELDRRHGKIFYKSGTAGVPFLSMRAEIEEAFRYKTRFQARDGSTVGFVPDICVPFSTSTPYCYDPEAIEELRARVDCMLSIYDTYYDSLAGSNLAEADTLYAYLEENFGVREEPNPLGGIPRSYDGFERLYAELLIMLGDEAYTSAFESRFDLAGSLAASFEGSKFETDGVDLSGIAGFEMVKLYQAVQYYEMVLDRFYDMGPALGAALASGVTATDRNFVSAATVSSYFDRLIRASTQRSRALSEIARRYQNLNRPDLAGTVIARAYTATYLESVILANLIVRLYDEAGGSERDQILAALEQSQIRYRMALLDLENVSLEISENVNTFGYPADYIPFPALDNTSTISSESGAFTRVLRTSLSKLDVARTREQTALVAGRSYETDEASFQAELTRISRTYENQLGEVCGLFTGRDGLVYPAVERYAYLDDRLALLGDPCGLAGNGSIHNAIVDLELRQLEIRQISTQMQNLFEEIDIERELAEAQCGIRLENAKFLAKTADQIFDLEEETRIAKAAAAAAARYADKIAKVAEIIQCEKEECLSTPVALGLLFTATAVSESAVAFAEIQAAKARRDRQKLETAKFGWEADQACESLDINRNAATQRLMLRLKDLQLSMISAEYRLQLALSEIDRMRQSSRRTLLEWDEALALAINVEAAKNDPNVRIYRNDAVINADISFEDALREAYRLTLVYEYYTSTTYAQRDQLFLIRMISSGDFNLENYVYELSNAYTQFEESFGLPDTRVEILSLRDDILQIPYTDAAGEALSIDERKVLMRERLRDPGLLNADGYLTVPFRTGLDRLSPLTRNHKIFWIEANIEGNDNGDFLGRLYLRQVGTSVIRTIDDTDAFYRFPDATAVINPFFNSSRQLKETPEIYRSFRLRDRPLVNTNWELVVNQRDELVNQDINLDELTDIKLYIYYTDFTVY